MVHSSCPTSPTLLVSRAHTFLLALLTHIEFQVPKSPFPSPLHKRSHCLCGISTDLNQLSGRKSYAEERGLQLCNSSESLNGDTTVQELYRVGHWRPFYCLFHNPGCPCRPKAGESSVWLSAISSAREKSDALGKSTGGRER